MARRHSILIVLFLLPLAAGAHLFEYGTITTDLSARDKSILLNTEVSQNTNISGFPADKQRQFYADYFSERFLIKLGGEPCSFVFKSYDPSLTAPKSSFTGEFLCPANVMDIADLKIKSTLFNDQFRNFDHFIKFSFDQREWQFVLTANRENFPDDVEAEYIGERKNPPFFQIARQFIWLGVTHIWTGYDHILFLLSLILLLRFWKGILLLVTAFTVAHSITLISAGLEGIRINPRIVEPAIAVSILYMAARNTYLLRKSFTGMKLAGSGHWVGAFGFGLVHGLGFAGALAETTIPENYFVPALIFFNVGIEAGQIVLLLFFVPLLFQIDKLPQARKFLFAASLMTGLLAIVWIFQRLFG